ncbi:MAG: TonB-dependent siderophore receptor, partial [Caulobacteraceae bacterium]
MTQRCGVALSGILSVATAIGVVASLATPALADPQPAGGNIVSQVVVTADKSPDAGYVSTASRAGSKMATPVIEVPQSISVLTRTQLDDRDVQTLIQAVGYTPGVTAQAFGYDPRFDSFYIRGFDITYTGIYLDELRLGGGSFAIPRLEPYGVEDISILRGPASGLYGLGSPGGVVDATSKRPTQDPFGEVQLQAGSYDRYQGNLDIGGPVPGVDNLDYRFTGLARDADTWQPGAKDDRVYLAPAVTWRPDANTSLTVFGEYLTSRTTSNPSYFNTPEGQLTSLYSNDPAYGNQDQQQFRVGYDLEHRFNDAFSVRQNFRIYHVEDDAKYTEIDAIDPVADVGERSTGRVHDKLTTVTLDNQAQAKFSLGPIANTVLVGVDYQHFYLNDNIGFGTAPDLNLATLNYGAQSIPNITDYTTREIQLQDEVGVYTQEQARLGGFILTLNGRESQVWTSTRDEIGQTTSDQHDNAFTGRVGLTYVFKSGLAPYINYSTDFSPQIGTDASGTSFKPTKGEQEEVGIKYQMPNLPVLLTGAAFDIRQSNVLRTDPDNMAYEAATGEIRSRGVELEATASLRPGVNLTASYTHLGVTIVQGEAGTDGNKFSGIPGDSVSVFGKYAFRSSLLKGLGIGVGGRYVGSSYGDDENTFRNDGVTFMDGVLDYSLDNLGTRFKGVKLQVNGTNLLDAHHGTCQEGYCYLDEERQIIGSLVYRW